MRRNFRLILLPFAALVLGVLVIAACSGDDDNASSTPASSSTAAVSGSPAASTDSIEAAATQFMRDLITTYNSDDADGFVGKFTDKGILEFDGDDPSSDPENARASVGQGVTSSSTKITEHTISDISTSGDLTTLTIDTDDGQVLHHETFQLRKGGDSFLIDGYQFLPAPIPSGKTATAVEGNEYSFDFSASDIKTGQQAFTFSDTGVQYHEMRLLKVDDTTPAQQIVNDALAITDPSQLPADIESDEGSTVSAPGGTSTLVFLNPLASGRYLMICFIPDDDDGQPHAAHGMFKQLTVP